MANIVGTSDNDALVGTSDDDNIQGLGGNDTIRGNEGHDIIDGGDGDDTIDNNSTVSSVVHGGAGNDTITTTAEDGVIYGDDGDDTITNHTVSAAVFVGPKDTIYGGAGNDVISSLGAGLLDGGEGNDRIFASHSDTHSIGGEGDDYLVVDDYAAYNPPVSYYGTSLHCVLEGGEGNDYIVLYYAHDNTAYGGVGNDTINIFQGAVTGVAYGGAGDDMYIIRDDMTALVENAGEGTDTIEVQGAFVYRLPANIENALMSSYPLIYNGHLTGNDLDNILTGNVGNDTLDGDIGADTMIGGKGNDTFYVDNAGDIVKELSAQGNDTVWSSVSFDLAGIFVETLQLTGSADINATGNGQANSLTGNDGDNGLDGRGGADTLYGGKGDDTYTVDNAGDVVGEQADQGNDTVLSAISYALGLDVENLSLTGSANLNATGNSQANSLIGNTGNNTLNGGSGVDIMFGGAGNDTYVVDNTGDVALEVLDEGNDTVLASVSYDLHATIVETLKLTGTATINATGNSRDNALIGNSAANTLTGLAGNDSLDGRGGADIMVGGKGDDTYTVDNAGDVVTELTGEGNDTVWSSVTFSLVGKFAENVHLTGSANLDATGNSLDNILTGNDGNNTLNGGYGHDVLTGGLGADTFLFATASGADTISDFSAAQGDIINVHAYLAHATAVVSQAGSDVTIDLGGSNIITVQNTLVADLTGHIVW